MRRSPPRPAPLRATGVVPAHSACSRPRPLAYAVQKSKTHVVRQLPHRRPTARTQPRRARRQPGDKKPAPRPSCAPPLQQWKRVTAQHGARLPPRSGRLVPRTPSRVAPPRAIAGRPRRRRASCARSARGCRPAPRRTPATRAAAYAARTAFVYAPQPGPLGPRAPPSGSVRRPAPARPPRREMQQQWSARNAPFLGPRPRYRPGCHAVAPAPLRVRRGHGGSLRPPGAGCGPASLRMGGGGAAEVQKQPPPPPHSIVRTSSRALRAASRLRCRSALDFVLFSQWWGGCRRKKRQSRTQTQRTTEVYRKE